MSSSPPSTPSSADVTPQQIGKAFVVQYYRLLHEHPESLHRFYSTSSTFMHDDPIKTVTGTEEIAKRIEQLSLKQRHVKIRQVDCHSTVGSSVVVQVCGEISLTPVTDSNSNPTMKRFVQTFVLAPTEQSKQKYYVHNDIFRYQDMPVVTAGSETPDAKSLNNTADSSFGPISVPTNSPSPTEAPMTPSTSSKIQFVDNTIAEKKEEKSQTNLSPTNNMTPPVTPVDQQEKKEVSVKPKSYRDAIGKSEKSTTNSNEAQTTVTPAATATATTVTTSTSTTTVAATAAGTTTSNKSKKANKQQQKAAKAAAAAAAGGSATATAAPTTTTTASAANNRSTRGHPQDANEYYDDSWYYGSSEEGYLSTGYTDDQEVFVGHLSAQVTENEIRDLFRPYGGLLHIRIGNTGSQVGAANFAFVVCQSIEMAQAVVVDAEKFMKNHKIEIEAKKRRPFAHTFRPNYPTAASPSSYQSTGYSSLYYNQSNYYQNPPGRGARRGGRGAPKQ